MKSYGKMLRTLRSRAGYGLVQVAQKLQEHGFDVTNTHVSRWENGYNNPTLDQFVMLCALYGVQDIHQTFGEEDLSALGPALNREGGELLETYRSLLITSGWFGADDTQSEDQADAPLPFRLEYPERMRKELAARHKAAVTPAALESEPELLESAVREVPLYLVGPSAGFGNMVDETDYEMIPEPNGSTAQADFAVHVDGDSMEPVLSNGELIFVQSQPTLEDGEVGIVTFNGHTYVKQLRTIPDSGVWLVSANPGYQPMSVGEYDTLVVHGRVVNPHISPSRIALPKLPKREF